jgi:hypothetical protein
MIVGEMADPEIRPKTLSRLPKDLHDAIEEIAREHNRNTEAEMRVAFEEYVSRHRAARVRRRRPA